MSFRQVTILSLTAVAAIVHAVISYFANNQSVVEQSPVGIFRTFFLSQFAWIVAYAGILAFAIYQAFSKSLREKILEAIFPWFSLAIVAQIMWIICGYLGFRHVALGIAFVGIAVQAGMYYILSLERPRLIDFQMQDRLLVYFPVSLFFGWSLFNIIELVPATLLYYGVNSLGFATIWWVAVLIGLCTALAAFFLLQSQDFPLAIMLLWGIFGVYLYNFREQVVAIATISSLFVVMVSAAIAVYQWLQLRKTAVNPNDYF